MWIPIVMAAVFAFAGWATLQIVDYSRKTAVLEQRINSQEQWLESIDKKLDQVADDTAAIRVSLGETPHV